MKAFPAYEWNKAHGQMMAVGGMNLRDYFAAKAMESDIANWSIEAEKTREIGFWRYDEIATRAYAMADAMMKARENDC
jgi:hypothetical protein